MHGETVELGTDIFDSFGQTA